MLKITTVFNHFLVITTAAFAVGYFIDNESLGIAMMGLFVIGCFQVFVALLLTLVNYSNRGLQLYWILVALFFGCWWLVERFEFLAVAPFIALYFSYLLHQKNSWL